MTNLQLFAALFFSISAAALVIYGLVDCIQFYRAASRAIKSGRIDEWFKQPNRYRLGAGFKLFRHFSKP